MTGTAVAADPDINRQVGAELRRIRQSIQTGTGRRLALQDVETATDGLFKATILGAYERGERTVTIPAFLALCAFYKTSAADLIARVTGDDIGDNWPSIGGRTDVTVHAPLGGVS